MEDIILTITRPHGLEVPIEDRITLSLFNLFPKSFLRTVRDHGGIRNLNDGFVSLLALILCFSRRSVVYNFTLVSSRIKKFYYEENSILEVYNDITPKESTGTLAFVHGGAWGSGKPWMYRVMAKNMAKLLGLSTVVLIGYEVYPESTIEYQTESVILALKYIRKCAQQIQVNLKKPLVLSGHSSGGEFSRSQLLHQF